MKQVRYQIFETNSSSTHAMTLCTGKEYEDWKNGKTMLNTHYIGNGGDFVDFDTARRSVSELRSRNGRMTTSEDVNSDMLYNYGFVTYDEYWDDREESEVYESFHETKMLENGESIVAFGYYGYDG